MSSPAGGALAPGTGVDAAALPLAHEPLPTEEVRDGAPTAASVVLAALGDTEIGVWEMTPGTASDTEADEVFVVLSGRASIAFDDPDLPDLEVGAGSVVRLADGQRTVWTVSETLRKIYIA
ncbi:cupin domain-containing protein [Microbacterium sp. EST19A]|uniref:cupin domain-containing protein n=1 Tax=Microbacterium sp. EST19A TaxID=2862681 RepID=UPI001CBAE01C|nr:cupin domain-containing protein [Microbacterium sp. EST19A]